jgi:2-dehydro-3-deoxyphosphooctonate aldolase (KDO 8-P synthase)
VFDGPCVIESREHSLKIANAIQEITEKVGIPFIFKNSFDKANRSTFSSYRGLGIDEGLSILSDVKTQTGIPVLTDIHEASQANSVADVADVLQIPAFLCRQTDLLVAAAKTGKPVNVKKGQFLSPHDIPNIIEKIHSTKNDNILITERGTSFGYNNLVNDFRSLEIMKKFKYPVIFDATHSVQEPGGLGHVSGGKREFIPVLAIAAVSVGIAGIFIETHEDPDNAPSDGPNMLNLKDLKELLLKLKDFDNLAKS